MDEQELKQIITDCEAEVDAYRNAGQVGSYDPCHFDLVTIHTHKYSLRPESLAAHQDLRGRTGIGEVYARMHQAKDALYQLRKPEWAKR
jgi:hypothetical protein